MTLTTLTKLSNLLIISAFSIFLSGCFEPQPPKIIVKYKYIYPPIVYVNKPIPDTYSTYSVKFNNIDYICLDRPNAAILAGNWESYKAWAEVNFNILKSLDINKTNKPNHNNQDKYNGK